MSNIVKEPKKVFREIGAIVNAARYNKDGELYVMLNDSQKSKEVIGELQAINSNVPRFGKVILSKYIKDPELMNVITDTVVGRRGLVAQQMTLSRTIA